MSDAFSLPLWPYAYGGPLIRGRLRTEPEDFFVDEQLGFEPSGEGGFVWLRMEKRGSNTDWVAGKIAELAAIKPHEVGYCGKKDRHAVTRQWFSVPCNRESEPDWSSLDNAEIRVLDVARDNEKLRPGDHRSNHFKIQLRQVEGDIDGCMQALKSIKSRGFPNYFGEQRFGRENANLAKVEQWFSGEHHPRRSERGMLMSAARSFLFNQVLSRRVELGAWNQPMSGDLMIASDSGHSFPVFRLDDQLSIRSDKMEITPTGPLYGPGEPRPAREAGQLEQRILDENVKWRKGLDALRMRMSRRELRAVARGLQWSYDAGVGDLTLSFELSAGAYATSMLREIAVW